MFLILLVLLWLVCGDKNAQATFNNLVRCYFLLLNGCTTVGNIGADFQILKGQSIGEVAAFLDNPDNHHELSNSKEYIWVNTENVKLTLPNTTARHSASQSREHTGVSEVANFRTKTDWYSYNWKLTLRTHKEDIIASTTFEGDAIGCRVYKKSRRDYASE